MTNRFFIRTEPALDSAAPTDFDHETYKNRYSDISSLGDRELEEHWLLVGVKEGRSYLPVPEDFDHITYREKYSDLAVLSNSELERHWVEFGRFESRTYCRPPRFQKLTQYIAKSMQGLEIAPYHSPVTPKRLGYNCKVLDIFGSEHLKRAAESDPSIPNEWIERIESVDFIGSASNLYDTVSTHLPDKSLDYIVSSHNFEHLPDPIRFLQDSSKLLKDKGVISMAIPDHRCCFDYFRWPTTLTSWLEAFYSNKTRPSPFDVFDMHYCNTNNFGRIDYPVEKIHLSHRLSDSHALLSSLIQNETYIYNDAHVSVFTPSSFRLLILELKALEMIDLEIIGLHNTVGNEFIVHLKKSSKPSQPNQNLEKARRKLNLRVIKEVSKKIRRRQQQV